MKTKVSKEGLFIPKQLLQGIDLVEIRQVERGLLIVPVEEEDSIYQLGTSPIRDAVEDASANHDQYLYNP